MVFEEEGWKFEFFDNRRVLCCKRSNQDRRPYVAMKLRMFEYRALFLEVFFARIFPGALNVGLILVIAKILGVAEYGQFSLVLATIMLFVSLFSGPIEHAIVPLHARQSLNDGKAAFERQLFGAALCVVGLVGALAVVPSVLGFAHPAWMLLFAASALSGIFQTILRARLLFWRYGAAATAKALAALALVALFLHKTPDASTAVLLYALGVVAGAFAGWLVAGSPWPRLPDRAFLREVLPVGSGLTISTIAEAVLFVGTRYAIAAFGSPQFLGVFSFALDLAQRSVGVVINIASFAIIPRAYVTSAKGDDRMFGKMLVRGALGAGGLSAIVFAVIILLEYSGVLASYVGENFGHAAFVAVSVAVVINRLKKLAVDPVLVSRGVIRAIPLAYLVVGPLSLLSMAVLMSLGKESLVLIIYPTSYFLVALFTFAALRVASAKAQEHR